MMKKQIVLFASVLGIFCLCDGFAAEAKSSAVRTIRLLQDDAQVRFASKIYELKHISAEEILPFVNSAILRYSVNSTIRRVTTVNKKVKGALLVSTGEEFMPYVDKIVSALDRPGKMKKASAISGTGVTRIAYTPKYRAAGEFSSIINSTLGSNTGNAYVNKESNTIFWRDQNESAKRTLSWVQVLDQPLPQVKIRLNYYELRDSDLKDWGLDYLAWKNGPGVNLLNVGYNAGKIAFDQVLGTALNAAAFTSTWGLGGFITALPPLVAKLVGSAMPMWLPTLLWSWSILLSVPKRNTHSCAESSARWVKRLPSCTGPVCSLNIRILPRILWAVPLSVRAMWKMPTAAKNLILRNWKRSLPIPSSV